MYARIAAGHFGSLQVQLGQFPCSGQRLTVRHNLCNYSPFVRGLRRERLWIEQERLRSSRSSAITPRGKDSVARHNASREVRDIVEGRTLAGDNHVGQQRILGVHEIGRASCREGREISGGGAEGTEKSGGPH